MDDYDGYVTIKTELNTNGFVAGAQDIQKGAQEAANKVQNIGAATRASVNKQVRALAAANNAYREQAKAVEALRQEIEDLKSVPVESEAYKNINAELAKTEAEYDKIIEKQNELIQLKGAEVDKDTTYQRLMIRENNLDDTIERLKAERDKLEASGGRWTIADTTREEKKLAAEEAKQRKMLIALNERYVTLRERIRALGGTAEDPKQKPEKETRRRRERVRESGLNFKNLLQYAVGLRSIYAIVSKIRAAAKESIAVIAQQDPAFNQTISRFVTAVKQIKADVGGIIEPIINAFAPVLTQATEKIHDFAVGVAQFVAALVGQNYIQKATVQAVDYAKAMNSAADSTQRALGAYDKLQVITDNSDAKNTLALTKDTVKYTKEALNDNSWYVKLGKKLHETFEWIFSKFTAIKEYLEKQKWVQDIVGNLKKLLSDPETFLVTIGTTLVVSKLAKMITGGVTSGVNNGITSSKLGQGLILTATAVIGFKIGNYLYNNFEDVRNAANGFIEELFGDPQKKLNTGGKEGKGVIGEYSDAYMEKGIGGIVEQWFSNAKEVLSQSFAIRKGSIADALINHDDIKVRMPKLVIPELSEAEKNVLAQQNARRIAQEKANVAAARAAFIAAVSPYWEDIKLQFTIGFEAKFGKTPDEAIKDLKDKFSNAWNNPSNKLKTAIDTAKQELKTLWNKFFPDSKTTNFGLGEKMRTLGEKITYTWKTEKKTVWRELVGVKNELAELIGDAWNGAFEDVFSDDGSKKYGGAATGKLGKIVSFSGTNGFKGLSGEIAERLDNAFTQQGTTAAKDMIIAFNATIKADTTIAQTLTQKITAAIAASYSAAAIVYNALYSPLLSGKIAPASIGKSAAVSTTKAGDIVLKVDGKEMARVVYNDAKKQYEQTGKNKLLLV